MKKNVFYLLLILLLNNVYSLEDSIIQEKIENTVNNINKQINEVYQNNKMFHFIVEEDDLINEKKYINDIYFYKNNLTIQISETDKLLYHYIYNDEKFYEIVNNKKKLIKSQNLINNSFFSFWWNFLNIDDISNFIKIDNTYICEIEQENLLIKLLLDEYFNIIQLEIKSKEDIVRYKVIENLKLQEKDIYFPKHMYIYIDSVAIKENKILEGEIITLDEAKFDLSKYKKISFIKSFIDYFNIQ